METKQIINWLRDKAARAEELSWQRMLKVAADRLVELDVGRKTNGDMIRTVSDEQLALIMVQLSDLDSRIPFCMELPECENLLDTDDGIPIEKCAGCMLAWLQKPAEGD